MSYDTYEAARLLSWSNKQAGIPPLTEAELTEWIDAGVGGLDWEDVWEEDGEVQRYIDFPTLISLRLICSLYSAGVSFEEIKNLALLLRQERGLDYPFASRLFWDTGDRKSPIQFDSSASTLIFTDMVGRQDRMELEFDANGIAYAWLPVKDVVIDARVVSGSPCVAGTRTPTWVFPGMLEGGDNIEELADGYRLTKEQVRNVLDWERQLDSACA